MVMNFVSYKLHKLFACLMCFQMFFTCINHFLQFMPFLLGPFWSVKQGFFCISLWLRKDSNNSSLELCTVTCVRFPWQHDVGALSRNNGIVQHCCVSLVTQQYWTALTSLADNNVNKQHCYAHNNRQAFPWLWDGCLRTSTDIGSVLEFTRVQTCIWLGTPFGWKINFVSGNCV
jgi:hypothetical protein